MKIISILFIILGAFSWGAAFAFFSAAAWFADFSDLDASLGVHVDGTGTNALISLILGAVFLLAGLVFALIRRTSKERSAA